MQSFGSEDRVTPHGAPIPASDQIYEFIVFQAAQIKDLVVAPNAPPPVDPAIIQAVSQAMCSSCSEVASFDWQLLIL